MNFNTLVAQSHHMLSVQNLYINSTALSIASVKWNPFAVTSEYIDYIFGSKAIYLSEYVTRAKENKVAIYDEAFEQSLASVRSKVDYSKFIYRPKCSLEMLGYSLLDQYAPIQSDTKKNQPAIGFGKLTYYQIVSVGDIQAECIYRGLFENWLVENENYKPNYRTTIFYCPIKNGTVCNQLRYHEGKYGNPWFKLRIDMYLKPNVTWSAVVHSKLRSRYLSKLQINPTAAVCTVMPYVSHDSDKVIANIAIFITWLKYYLRLGFKVFVYDRDGLSYQQTIKYQYDVMELKNESWFSNLIYYNFSILGSLAPASMKNLALDNTEMNTVWQSKDSRESFYRRRWRANHDKQLSFTHCRFEASTVFGIKKVAVVDFDEFLYCPVAKPDFLSQRLYINKILHSYHVYGVDQITFAQRILSNKTSSILDCLIEKAKMKQSLFDCYASDKWVAGVHSEKSFHLRHICPMTGYHTSCPHELSTPATHDCQCNSEFLRADVCSFIHVVTNQHRYNRRSRYTLDNEPLLRESTNEIKLMMDSSTDATKYF